MRHILNGRRGRGLYWLAPLLGCVGVAQRTGDPGVVP
jgi:hypothetical protein